MLFRSGVLCVVGALVATVGVLVAPTSSAVPAASVAAASVTFTNYTTANGLGNNYVTGVYAVNDTVYAATTGGLSISTDGGANFTNRTIGDGLGNNTLRGVYAVDDTVYAATTGGLSISTDGGANFTNRTIGDGLGSNTVRGVYAAGATVYAATGGGLSISTDGGATFTNYTTTNGLGNNIVNGVFAVGDTVYAATDGGLSIGRPAVPPVPPVVYPPGAPTGVTDDAGDGQVSVSWTAPVSAGSFPITTYAVSSTSGNQGCLTSAPAVTCVVSGLTNGTPYSFQVRALNGAGWGQWSATSDPVTPEAPVATSILITGSRGEVRGRPGVIVTGTSTGLGMGAIVRPMVKFPGQTSYTQGTASILVDEAGDFTWQRRTSKKTYVYVKTEDGTARSNRVIIPVG